MVWHCRFMTKILSSKCKEKEKDNCNNSGASESRNCPKLKGPPNRKVREGTRLGAINGHAHEKDINTLRKKRLIVGCKYRNRKNNQKQQQEPTKRKRVSLETEFGRNNRIRGERMKKFRMFFFLWSLNGEKATRL